MGENQDGIFEIVFGWVDASIVLESESYFHAFLAEIEELDVESSLGVVLAPEIAVDHLRDLLFIAQFS